MVTVFEASEENVAHWEWKTGITKAKETNTTVS
jgi:hypothetical protein